VISAILQLRLADAITETPTAYGHWRRLRSLAQTWFSSFRSGILDRAALERCYPVRLTM